MPKFPEPPPASDLATIEADWHIMPAGTPLWRLYARRGAHPRSWNTFRSFGPVPSMRFDHHKQPPHEQERAILYAATLGPICVAESFQRTRTIDRVAGEAWLAGFTIVRNVRLLNPCDRWPTRAGASMALNTGMRARARRWSCAIYAAYPEAEGLWYPSSMYGNQPAVALYERSGDALAPTPFFHLALSVPALFVPLDRLAREIGYRLV